MAGDVAGKIAAGDLSSTIEIKQNDEVGTLLDPCNSCRIRFPAW